MRLGRNVTRVLGIDDERPIRKLLERGLKGYGYEVTTATGGAAVVAFAVQQSPDIAILGVNCDSGSDGLRVCEEIRQWSNIPIIVIADRDDKRTKIAMLDAGADDYLAKPFDLEELEARIRAVLRRSLTTETSNAQAEIHIKDLMINQLKRQVTLKGEVIHLTPREYELLRILASHPGKVLTYQLLLDSVWRDKHVTSEHNVRVYVNTLRKKLRENLDHAPSYIFTELGIGYRFADY